MVLVGGSPASNSNLLDTWTFDGTTWNQATPVHSPSQRYSFSLAYDATRKRTVLFGGASMGQPLTETWEWDGNDWTQLSPVTTPSITNTSPMTFDAKLDRIVLFAGNDNQADTVQETWLWDGTDWSLDAPLNTPTFRKDGNMAFDSARNVIVMFGGQLSEIIHATYNDTWTFAPAGAPAVFVTSPATGATTDSAQSIFFVATDAPTSFTCQVDNDVAAPCTSPFIATPLTNGQHVVTIAASNDVGSNSTSVTFNSNVYDWTLIAAGSDDPVVGNEPTIAYDSNRNRAVLFGGQDATTGIPINDTWELDNGVWSHLAPAHAPSPRNGGGMAYDASRGVVVLFGGNADGVFQNDTWTWDGTDWTQLSPVTSPSGRSAYHQMEFDATTNNVLLFGGSTGGQMLGDTWIWDGANWTQQTPNTSPPARTRSAMVYDAVHEQIVMFSGLFQTGFDNDTWVWSGSDWTKLSPANSPSQRGDHAMAYDAGNARIVLYGGNDVTNHDGAKSDTWQWDGVTWTQLAPSSATPRYYGTSMVYDSVDGEIILFGQQSAVTNYNTWAFTAN